MGSKACTIWFTGLSGAGKSTCSRLVVQYLRTLGLKVELLDGDEIRTNISSGLGFTREDRDRNIRRIGYVCHLLTRNEVFTCVAAISPYREVREEIRKRIGDFVMVYCNAPIEELERRDGKGLYKLARDGKIKNFTGISDPYEPPENPDAVVLSDGTETPEESAAKVVIALEKRGYLPKISSDPVSGVFSAKQFHKFDNL
jgi:adenylylsulfate kinase